MSVGSFNWFAVYTKPKQELIALRNLERQSFECYLPMSSQIACCGAADGAIDHEPLFPRYLFLGACEQEQSLAAVRSTRGVVDLVRAGIELTKIPTAIIAGLRRRVHPVSGVIQLSSDPSVRDEEPIFDGAFADLEGVFKERRGLSRSFLLLDILGRNTVAGI